ncbi:23S rRNA (adenine(2503)-C(2))-methyltransferase @ tRNA (adenine(37)-C(2))-methyltransferase, partial [hydrothermal vent metagenome]
MKDDKINLLGLDRVALEKLFAMIGEPKYRAAQFMKCLYHQFESNFDNYTTFSKLLRNKMQQFSTLQVPQVVSEKKSQDGTIKWLLQMAEGNAIETVYIPETKRGTLCISSQIGCSLNCSFCATGAGGFNRHLTTAEIIGQVWVAANKLGQSSKNRRITNVVLMGMGEPLANYPRVLPALKIMLDDFGFGLAARRVTVSTSGMVPYIYKLKQDIDVSLAVSLHAPYDLLRNKLVPLNKKYNIAALLQACNDYIKDKRKAKITFEYTLIKDVNDKPEHARALTKLLADTPCKINLIPFNPFPGNSYQRSLPESIELFQNICEESRIVTTVRKTRGDDINAAC